MKRKFGIADVITILYDNYRDALEEDYVHKPFSYALYNTWKLVDKTEEDRFKEEDK